MKKKVRAINNAQVKPMLLPHPVMSAYFCPHSAFNAEYLIEFVCLKSDLINNSNN